MKTLAKKIYEFLPLKKQFFHLLRAVWKPGPRIYRHLHFKGIITVPINENASFKIKHHGFVLENELFWSGIHGEFEKKSMEVWMKLCQRSEVIFDIGANTGVFALVASTLKPEAKVYAFEPIQRVFEKLKENNNLNNYHIQCQPLAVSDSNGKAIVYDPGTEHLYSVTVNKNLAPSNSAAAKVEIDTIRLDTFIEKNSLTKIDLMKVDVETHEPEVLKGMGVYLKLFKPSLLIEILNDEAASQLENILKDMDYHYFNINEASGLRKVDHLSKSESFNYLICSSEIAQQLKLIN